LNHGDLSIEKVKLRQNTNTFNHREHREYKGEKRGDKTEKADGQDPLTTGTLHESDMDRTENWRELRKTKMTLRY
jgi:hypothetical protein